MLNRTPEEEIKIKQAIGAQEGELLESLLQHPGWYLVEGFIKRHRDPNRLVIKEKTAALSSLAVLNHISGQIYILDKLANMLKSAVGRKNKIAQEEQNKQKTSPK